MSEETHHIRLNQKTFQPQFHDLVPLPTIQQFTLDDLINVQLKQESQQVVDSLLNVTTNYQNDLRLEIKRKLSTEQKIQFKNIEIAKLTSSLNKLVHSKRKKIKKTLDTDLDLDELMNVTVAASDKCRSITEKLARIDQLVSDKDSTLQNPHSVNRLKYPTLHRLFHPKELEVLNGIGNGNDNGKRNGKRKSKADGDGDNDNDVPNDILSRTSLDPVENVNEEGHGELRKQEDLPGFLDFPDSPLSRPSSKSKEREINESSFSPASPNGNDKSNQRQDSPHSPSSPNSKVGISTPRESVSLSLSPSIPYAKDGKSKERESVNPSHSPSSPNKDIKSKRKSEDLPVSPLSSPKKYNKLPDELQHSPKDVETSQNGSKIPPINSNDIPMDAAEFEMYMSESIYKYREARDRRYSQLDPFEDRTRISHKFSTNNPINLLYSSLLSNPKYIDSSPINEINPFSSMLSIKSSATIKLSLQTSHHKKLRINGAPITSASYLNSKTKQICACSDDQEHRHDTAESLAKKSITENLHHLAIGSDDELWNSSGLTTETEEDEESTKIPSSGSSDSDLLDSNANESIANINSIYSALKLEKKRKILQNDKRSRLKKKKKRVSVRPDEVSPSPKHKPSHHILKPKRSILKLKSNLKWRPTVSTEVDINEVSALADVNTAFDNTTRSSITDYTVSGTIVGFPVEDSDYVQEDNEVEAWYGGDEDDVNSTSERSIKSISRLKDLLDL